jgi:hypothetical protein
MGFVQNSVFELMLNEYNISCTRWTAKQGLVLLFSANMWWGVGSRIFLVCHLV